MTELWRLSATDIAALVARREISALEATDSALERLAAVNPALNAVVQEMPEAARDAAKAIDVAIAAGARIGPLAGVPVTVKVNVDQAGFATTNGLRMQKDLVAERDNPVVANLKRAGAIIVGRTNTPAFSLRWFTRNGIHGETLNPRNPKLTPGGSSGGAASATAAGIGAIGHGTDIAGSVRYPAYACGIHGLRPSFGRIPAFNYSAPDRNIGAQIMAVSGPLARTVSDLRLGFEAMAAPDIDDPWHMPVPLALDAPRTAALDLEPEGMRVAPEVKAALSRAADALRAAGWRVVEAKAPSLEEAVRCQLMLWLAEYHKTGMGIFDQEGDADALFVSKQLAAHAAEPSLGGVLDALQRRVTELRVWRRFFAEHSVLISPVSGELPFRTHSDVESEADFARIVLAQRTQIGLPFYGLPGLTVSTGMVEGPDGPAPVGVQLVGDRFQEEILLRAGEIIEGAGAPPSPVDPAA